MLHLIILVLLLTPKSQADEPLPDTIVGLPVVEIIEAYRSDGHNFAYSTALVTKELLVEAEPDPGSAIDTVIQILAPHGLTIRTEAGVHLIVPLAPTKTVAESVETAAARSQAAEFENVVVSASRYAISRDVETSRAFIDQRSIQNMPDLGQDPIRVTQRLPGTAASGASARAHFRGGEQGEVGIMLNGQWLFDPFHMRDYQSVFSAIDARAIDGVEVFTGGFPARYGDRMSGLVLLDSIEADRTPKTELGLSVFNTSLLSVGTADKHNWLFSARRGNLDIVIDPKLGQPSYFDVFAEYGFEFSPRAKLSLNALYADDAVELVLESEPTERDQVTSDTRNAQFWVQLNNAWSESLSSSTVLSFTDYANRRTGFSNDSEKIVASVFDYREVRQVAFRQNWYWRAREGHHAEWGLHVSNATANFDYAGTAEYFGLQARYQNQPSAIARRVLANVEGGRYALYFSDRWKLNNRLVFEWGLRWDDQTYTDLSSDTQLSPRLNLLYSPNGNTEIRFSAGRYFQSQPIESLQVEDGISNYWPAQRADQVALGIQRRFGNNSNLRVEAFHKNFGKVRPRFENLFDPLGTMPELQSDRIRLEPTSSLARGIEISLSRSANDRTWWGSYTWSRVTDRIVGRDVVRSWDQTHALQGGFQWQGEKWSFSTAASAHTGWPNTDLVLTDTGIAVTGERNALRHDLYASVDARVSRRFDVRRGSLLLFFEISNLLNRRNDCCTDWDLGETGAGAEFLESSQDYWLPLLPAIGILWEF